MDRRLLPQTFGVLALLLAGCDPVWSGEGHLIDTAGTTVSGATVTLACPSGRTETVKASASGEFRFGGISSSFEAPKCMVRISKPGFVPRTLRTLDLCYRNTNDGSSGPCKPGEGNVVLTRASSAAPPPAPAHS